MYKRQSQSLSTLSSLSVDRDWLKATLKDKIENLDWAEAKTDVRPFLRPSEAASLDLWNVRFFNSKLDKLIEHNQSIEDNL